MLRTARFPQPKNLHLPTQAILTTRPTLIKSLNSHRRNTSMQNSLRTSHALSLSLSLSLHNRLTRTKLTRRRVSSKPRHGPVGSPQHPTPKRSIVKGRSKRRRLWWGWAVVGPVMAVLLATAITTSNTGSNISFFNNTQRSCHCPPQISGRYTGMVEDCCCDYETVNRLNQEVLHPLLEEIVKTPFFRYFKVKLWCDCPFWRNDGMCRLRDCSVCECPENEFPANFRKPSRHRLPSNNFLCQEGKPEENVDRTLDSGSFRGWIESDNPWTNENEFDSGEMSYVNLLLNPERYTGYAGSSARRIWDAVYLENCPKYSSGEICQEKKVLYKLISGLHTSISVHIAADYLLDENSNLWGQNHEVMYDRVLRYPNRVRNLYFTFLFVLRAVTKAADYLEFAEYDTGNYEDLKTQSYMKQLLHHPTLQAACPLPFDEAKLWQDQSEPELKQQTQKQFRNISALMDCVGCEKCRLWGKLQVLGLGTALKILFSVDQNHRGQQLQLQRNEVIALINLLHLLSESIKVVHEKGPLIEKIVEKQIYNPHTKFFTIWSTIWESLATLGYYTAYI